MTPDNKDPDSGLSGNKKLLYCFPALIGLSGGLFASLDAGFKPATLLGMALLTLAGAFVGWRLIKQQQITLQKLSAQYQQNQLEQLAAINAYIDKLEWLFLETTPILLHQVQTSRFLTEREIAALTRQFAAISAELLEIIASSAHIASADFTDNLNSLADALPAIKKTGNNTRNINNNGVFDTEYAIYEAMTHLKSLLSSLKNDTGMLSSNSERINNEINAILVAFQFQDRTSQMLMHVESILTCLHETVQAVRGQGNTRHAGLIDIEQTLQQMNLDYSMPEQHITLRAYQAVGNTPENADELTFF